MDKDITMYIYGEEITTLGLKEAFESNMKLIEEISQKEEVIKELEKLKGDINLKAKCQKISTKLNYIDWTLRFKDFEKEKNVIPSLIRELESIVSEIKEIQG